MRKIGNRYNAFGTSMRKGDDTHRVAAHRSQKVTTVIHFWIIDAKGDDSYRVAAHRFRKVNTATHFKNIDAKR